MGTFISMLENIAGKSPLPADVRFADLGVDSLSILEWLYQVEDELKISLDDLVIETTAVKRFGDSTIRALYEILLKAGNA